MPCPDQLSDAMILLSSYPGLTRHAGRDICGFECPGGAIMYAFMITAALWASLFVAAAVEARVMP